MRISDWSSDVCSSDLVGVRRGEDASWLPAQSPAQLTQAVHDNLRNLGLDRLNVVNLRLMGDVYAPTSDEQLEEQFSTLARLRKAGLIAHLGLSNATIAQVAQAQIGKASSWERVCE